MGCPNQLIGKKNIKNLQMSERDVYFAPQRICGGRIGSWQIFKAFQLEIIFYKLYQRMLSDVQTKKVHPDLRTLTFKQEISFKILFLGIRHFAC